MLGLEYIVCLVLLLGTHFSAQNQGKNILYSKLVLSPPVYIFDDFVFLFYSFPFWNVFNFPHFPSWEIFIFPGMMIRWRMYIQGTDQRSVHYQRSGGENTSRKPQPFNHTSDTRIHLLNIEYTKYRPKLLKIPPIHIYFC